MPDLYAFPYPTEFPQYVAAEVATAPGAARAYPYFNHDSGGAAINNARAMQQLTAAPGGPAAQRAAGNGAG